MHHSQVGFVNQGGGLQSMILALPIQIRSGDLFQLAVQQRHKVLKCLRVSRAPLLKQHSDVMILGHRHPHSGAWGENHVARQFTLIISRHFLSLEEPLFALFDRRLLGALFWRVPNECAIDHYAHIARRENRTREWGIDNYCRRYRTYVSERVSGHRNNPRYLSS